MSTRISLAAVGHATSIFLATTFTLCVAFDLIFPDHAMYAVWQKLLPGFEWISWQSFLIGLIESYGYGWYFALIWVPLYNVFAARYSKCCCHGKEMSGSDSMRSKS
jgi:cytochrome c biogenesis protein CcdA